MLETLWHPQLHIQQPITQTHKLVERLQLLIEVEYLSPQGLVGIKVKEVDELFDLFGQRQLLGVADGLQVRDELEVAVLELGDSEEVVVGGEGQLREDCLDGLLEGGLLDYYALEGVQVALQIQEVDPHLQHSFQELLYEEKVFFHLGQVLQRHICSNRTTHKVIPPMNPIHFHQLPQNLLHLYHFVLLLHSYSTLDRQLRRLRHLLILVSLTKSPLVGLLRVLQLIEHLVVVSSQLLVLPPQLLQLTPQSLNHDALPVQLFAHLVHIHPLPQLVHLTVNTFGLRDHILIVDVVLLTDQLSFEAEVYVGAVGELLGQLGDLGVPLLDLGVVVLDQLHGLVVLGRVRLPTLKLPKILNHLLSLLLVDVKLQVQSLLQLGDLSLPVFQGLGRGIQLLFPLFGDLGQLP